MPAPFVSLIFKSFPFLLCGIPGFRQGMRNFLKIFWRGKKPHYSNIVDCNSTNKVLTRIQNHKNVSQNTTTFISSQSKEQIFAKNNIPPLIVV